MSRQRAWRHYFATGDRTPLCWAYWDSIQYIAWAHYPKQQDDMFQFGMMGLLKAISRVDPKRVKGLDAWVFLNVRSMMLNARQFKPTVSLKSIEWDGEAFDDSILVEDEDQTWVDEALASLPEREAFILRLVHLKGYKKTEVGRMLGVSSMRIGQLEKRALERLRNLYFPLSPSRNS